MELKWKCKLCGKVLEVSSKTVDLGIGDGHDEKLEELKSGMTMLVKLYESEKADDKNIQVQAGTTILLEMIKQTALWDHLILEHNEHYYKWLRQNFEELEVEPGMGPFKEALEVLDKLYSPSKTLQEIRKDIEGR